MGCDSCQRSDDLLKVIQYFQSETTCTLGRCDHATHIQQRLIISNTDVQHMRTAKRLEIKQPTKKLF